MGGDAIWEASATTSASATTRPPTDGRITLERIECNAACDYAPVVMVNWEFFDNQTPGSRTASSSTTCARASPVVAHPRRRTACATSSRCPACWPASPTGGPTRASAPGPPPCGACGWPASAAGPRRARTRPHRWRRRRPRTDADAAGGGAEHLRARRRRRRPRARAPRPRRTAPRTTPTRRLRAGRTRHERPADAGPHQVLGRPPGPGPWRPTRSTAATRGCARRWRCRRPTWSARQGLRPARPRRRRLPDRHEVGLPARAGRRPPLPRGQRRRVRAGHLQGHPADDGGARSC